MALTERDKQKVLRRIRREEQQEINDLLRSAVVRSKKRYCKKDRRKNKFIDPGES